MKRTVPLLIAAVCGVVLIITAFIPATVSWGETATVWFDVLAAIAFVLGGGNLLKIHMQKVSDRGAGWAYSAITVATFLLTLTVGLLKWGVEPASDQEFYGQTFISMPISELPVELEFRLPVNLPGELADEVLPASVRRQLRMNTSDGRITELVFRGWITGGQTADLLNQHDLLEWKCAIEQLAELAVVPGELAGKVSYYADHQALSATGQLLPETAGILKSISAGDRWNERVEELQALTERQTSIELHSPPASLTIPAPFSDSLKREGERLTVTGPLTPAMRGAMTDVFPRVRPLSEAEVEAFVTQVKGMQGGLTDSQENLLTGLLHSIWNADQLLTTLNDAGRRAATRKTYCELLAEKQNGVTDLQMNIPSSEPNVTLNDAQVELIRSSVTSPEIEFTTLGVQLAAQGEWLPSQEAALQKFLASQPTLGDFKRSLAASLTSAEAGLSPEQYEFLLSDYRTEHHWKEQVFTLFSRSHRVKYPWSGAYLQDGTPFWWSYEYAIKPLTSTMFALLAFYVASAAFRAFRAKNFEAFLLLGTAFIILLGRTYAGVWLTSGLPDSLAGLKIENISVFVLSVINTAGNRAIMIGISLGIVSTSLKILLGVDRSYLGSGDD